MVTNQILMTTDENIRFLDHSRQQTIFDVANSAMTSFAVDDAIAEAVGDNLAPPTVRLWVHEPTMVLGIPDSRLPYLQDGLAFIETQGAKAIVRNSGGLAVFLDSGVLNMSFIIPNSEKMSINDGYEMMYSFIRKLLAPYTDAIKAFEIVGSYCPGDYDLSIRGYKFAGISQRRIRNSIAIQIYLDIIGNSRARAQIVKDFYAISKRDVATNYHYPEVDPGTMGSLDHLLQIPLSVDGIIAEIRQVLSNDYHLIEKALLPNEKTSFFNRLKQMKRRNERIQS